MIDNYGWHMLNDIMRGLYDADDDKCHVQPCLEGDSPVVPCYPPFVKAYITCLLRHQARSDIKALCLLSTWHMSERYCTQIMELYRKPIRHACVI